MGNLKYTVIKSLVKQIKFDTNLRKRKGNAITKWYYAIYSKTTAEDGQYEICLEWIMPCSRLTGSTIQKLQ